MRVNNVLLNHAKRSGFITKIEIVSRQAAAQTDYQIQVEDILSRKGDGEDITFAQKNQILNHWKESYASWKSDVWAKLPKLPITKSQILNILSGNPSASSASNGANTFEFFDDFEGASLDASKWEEIGTDLTVTVSNSIANIVETTHTSAAYIQTKDKTFSDPVIMEMYQKDYTAAHYPLAVGFGSEQVNAIRKGAGGDWYNLWCFKGSSESFDPPGGISDDNDWHKWKLIWKDGGAELYQDGVLKGSVSTNVPTIDLALAAGRLVSAGTGSVTTEGDIDWILVRKYASPSPLIIKRKISGKAGIIRAVCGGIAS